MSGYYITGVAFVERYKPDEGKEVGEIEVFDMRAVASIPCCDEREDFECCVYNEEDVPKEPGAYALIYAAYLHFRTDWWGEVDAKAEIMWFKIDALNEGHVADLLGTNPSQEEIEDMLNQKGFTRIDDGKGN